ncbi:hypothetical protein [Hymenobacter norwichensis]|uniref:hypothetical protein n=1 Tax=Hymenobacter norwichensis TaxID=223903 RepID=UPI0003B6C6D0|nr:hypothetical protein [Hymenobacter norwichensis]
MKYKLQPVEVDFVVRTTILSFQVSERASLPITIEVAIPNHEFEEEVIKKAVIDFPVFAKLEYATVNFWEANYDDFEVVDTTRDNLGLYYISNSSWDQSSFDPLQRFNLAHFLLVGYDSYIEVLASNNFEVGIFDS